MALRLSTGLRDSLMEKKATASTVKVASTTISFSNAGAGPHGGNQILDSANGLAGAIKRGKVTVSGSTSNNGTYDVWASASGYIEVIGALVNESAGASVTIVQASGGSFSDLFRNCVMDIFAGTQPTTADLTEGSSALVSISLAGVTFVPGSQTAGINFDDAIVGVLGKTANEVWSGIAVSTGTAGWFRVYSNSKVTGASTVAVRFDGAISTSGAQLNMSNTSITSGGTTTIDSGAISLPTL